MALIFKNPKVGGKCFEENFSGVSDHIASFWNLLAI
jgi:hypothetical protein